MTHVQDRPDTKLVGPLIYWEALVAVIVMRPDVGLHATIQQSSLKTHSSFN